MFCLPNSQQQQQQLDDEPNAFDLTWRNYLPSTAQLCSCLPAIGRQGIQLDDDNNIDHNSIAYYNDFYQANAVRGCLDNQHDREFDDLLLTNDHGSRHHGGKSKKRSKRKKYPKRRLLRQQEQEPDEQLTPYYNNDIDDYDDGNHYDHGTNNDGYYYDYQQQGTTVYEAYSDTEQQDAVYLGDDQIAKMVNHYDQGGKLAAQQQLCAPRAVPFMINDHDNQSGYSNEDDHHAKEPSIRLPPATLDGDDREQQTEHTPIASTAALAAQAILSEKLEDLTEKLAFIRNNMMDIGSSSTSKQHNSSNDDVQKEDVDDDTATLHTLKTLGKKGSSERLSISSDMDSIASEALLEYENTSQNHHRQHTKETSTTTTTSDYHNRRFSSNLGTDLRMPVGLDSPGSSSYTRQAHPFAYFTEQVDVSDEEDTNDNNESDKTTSGIQGAVLNFGKKWFG